MVKGECFWDWGLEYLTVCFYQMNRRLGLGTVQTLARLAPNQPDSLGGCALEA